MRKKIAVIGGGMAGTAAAYRLRELGHDVTIIERNEHLGGRIHSVLDDGTAVEMGAGFITDFYTNIHLFLEKTNLNKALVKQHTAPGLVRGGKIRMLTPRALAGTGVLSWGAKLHAAPLLAKILANWPRLDIHNLWRAHMHDDRSVAGMFTSNSGKEFLEYALQPILNGYLYWTPEQTSEAMTLIIGKAALLRSGTYKMQGGLQQIPEKAALGCNILLGHTVKEVRLLDSGQYAVTALHQGKQRVQKTDGVVCATTASAISHLIPSLAKRQRAFFASVGYSSTAVMAGTYRHSQSQSDKSIAFPRMENAGLAAVTISPEPSIDANIIKTFASGSAGKNLCGKPDSTIIQALNKAMEPVRGAIFSDNAKPAITHIQRWPEALPVFAPGHLKRLREFADGEIEDNSEALVFAGDYIGGPLIEGAFTSGVQAAERLHRRLLKQL